MKSLDVIDKIKKEVDKHRFIFFFTNRPIKFNSIVELDFICFLLSELGIDENINQGAISYNLHKIWELKHNDNVITSNEWNRNEDYDSITSLLIYFLGIENIDFDDFYGREDVDPFAKELKMLPKTLEATRNLIMEYRKSSSNGYEYSINTNTKEYNIKDCELELSIEDNISFRLEVEIRPYKDECIIEATAKNKLPILTWADDPLGVIDTILRCKITNENINDFKEIKEMKKELSERLRNCDECEEEAIESYEEEIEETEETEKEIEELRMLPKTLDVTYGRLIRTLVDKTDDIFHIKACGKEVIIKDKDEISLGAYNNVNFIGIFNIKKKEVMVREEKQFCDTNYTANCIMPINEICDALLRCKITGEDIGDFEEIIEVKKRIYEEICKAKDEAEKEKDIVIAKRGNIEISIEDSKCINLDKQNGICFEILPDIQDDCFYVRGSITRKDKYYMHAASGRLDLLIEILLDVKESSRNINDDEKIIDIKKAVLIQIINDIKETEKEMTVNIKTNNNDKIEENTTMENTMMETRTTEKNEIVNLAINAFKKTINNAIIDDSRFAPTISGLSVDGKVLSFKNNSKGEMLRVNGTQLINIPVGIKLPTLPKNIRQRDIIFTDNNEPLFVTAVKEEDGVSFIEAIDMDEKKHILHPALSLRGEQVYDVLLTPMNYDNGCNPVLNMGVLTALSYANGGIENMIEKLTPQAMSMITRLDLHKLMQDKRIAMAVPAVAIAYKIQKDNKFDLSNIKKTKEWLKEKLSSFDKKTVGLIILAILLAIYLSKDMIAEKLLEEKIKEKKYIGKYAEKLAGILVKIPSIKKKVLQSPIIDVE